MRNQLSQECHSLIFVSLSARAIFWILLASGNVYVLFHATPMALSTQNQIPSPFFLLTK
jgi:hypothetical protein